MNLLHDDEVRKCINSWLSIIGITWSQQASMQLKSSAFPEVEEEGNFLISVKVNHEKLKNENDMEKVGKVKKMNIFKKLNRFKNYDILKNSHIII